MTPRTHEISLPENELRFSYVRSSGPGGQNVNKVASKAVLRWSPSLTQVMNETTRQRFFTLHANRITASGDVVISSDRFRDQHKNIDDCLTKLKSMIHAALVIPRHRVKTKPSRGSVLRRQRDKSLNSKKKQSRRDRHDQD